MEQTHGSLTAAEKETISATLFSSVFLNAPAAMAIIDEHGSVINANEAYRRSISELGISASGEDLVTTYLKLTAHLSTNNLTHPFQAEKKIGPTQLFISTSVLSKETKHFLVSLEIRTVLIQEKEVHAGILEALLTEGTEIVTRHGKDFRYLYVSPNVIKYSGLRPEEFIGKSYREIGMPESICQYWDDQLRYVFRTKEKREVEFEIPGQKVFLHSIMIPEFDLKGDVDAVLILSRELSEKRDETLHKLSTHFQLATESAQVGTCYYDFASGRVEWSDLHKKLWGYAEEKTDMVYEDWHALLHPDDVTRVLASFEKAMQSNLLYSDEYRIVRFSDQEVRWIRSFGQFQHNEAGKPVSFNGISIDVTHEKDTQERLHQEEERFKATFENAAVGIAHVGLNGEWLRVNKKLCEILGYHHSELTTMSFQQITYPDDLEGDLELFNQLLAAKIETYSIEKRYIRKDGQVVWGLLTVSLVRNKNSEPDYFISVVQDISERKKAEVELKASHDRFKLINKATQEAIWDWNLLNDELVWNDAVQEMFHYLPDAIFNSIEWWYNGIHPEDRDRVVSGIHRVIDSGGSAWSAEYRFGCGDGSYKIVHDRGCILHDDGRPIRMLGSMQDITHRKQYEKTLKENEERFRTLANSISHLAWIADHEGNLYWFNDRWYAYTGEQPGQMKPARWQALVPPEFANNVTATLQLHFTGDEAWEFTFPLRRNDGEYRWYLTRAYPIKDGTGKVVQWVGTNTDIHQQKTTEEDLELLVNERTKELQRSNDDLLQFAHVASHDLKEPVRKILTFSNRLEAEVTPLLHDRGKSYVAKIHAAAWRMGQMIDGILQYSALDSIQQRAEKIDLNIVFENVINDMEVIINQKKAMIKLAPMPTVEGAQILLYQLFYNIVNNALKFVREGVTPMVSITSETLYQDGNDWVAIYIRDNGVGFDDKYSEKIFHTYARLYSKDQFEGTGLGLSLCKKIAERHGGWIKASGKVNEGAVFTVALPLVQPK